MAIKINLAKAVTQALYDYKNVTYEEMYDAAFGIVKKARKKLKQDSPRGRKSEKHYADSWKIDKTYKNNGRFSFKLYNEDKPGLTHLLENGHQLRQGGRTRKFVHIKPVEEWCVEEFEKEVEGLLKK